MYSQINEDVRELAKKLAQVEQDLITTKNNLEQANKDLEEKEKALQNVRIPLINYDIYPKLICVSSRPRAKWPHKTGKYN